MKSLKRGDFYTVPRIAWDNLAMKSGPMRDIYSIIHNISQDGDSACACTIQYFMNVTGASERTVHTIISQLVEAGYITRKEVGSGRGSYVEYRVNLSIVEECRKGAKFAPIKKGAICDTKGCKMEQKRVQNLHPENTNIILYKTILLPRVRAEEAKEKEEEILYNFFYWKNAQAPRKEVQNCLANWVLKENKAYGRELDTQEKILRWADGWELKTGTKRVDPFFLRTLNKVYGELLTAGDAEMAANLVSEKIAIVEGRDGHLYMVLPVPFVVWFRTFVMPARTESNAPEHWHRIDTAFREYARGRASHFAPFDV